jgi:arabinogalactan endo-1,4-beta-galactosidase
MNPHFCSVTLSHISRLVLLAALAIGFVAPLKAQQYLVGADVSFLASAEQQGIVFKENGQPKDVLAILREHNFNWVRLRIFHDPAASADKLPNDLNYTIALAKRAKAQGFRILLDFHYSDTWADPGKQFTPEAWKTLKHKQLAEKIFTYTRDTLAAFREADVLPDMVQTGNEITGGMDWPDGKLPDNWDNFADLLKAAIRGVDEGRGSEHRIPIMIHIERSGDTAAATWFFDKLNSYNLAYDVIGLSYYPRWHGSITALRQTLHDLSFRYRKPIVVVETAYNWTPGDFVGKKADFAESPEGQKQFLQAVDAAVRSTPGDLGRGVFWWEPAVPDGPIAGRALFDDKHNALPAITVFDQNPSMPSR